MALDLRIITGLSCLNVTASLKFQVINFFLARLKLILKEFFYHLLCFQVATSFFGLLYIEELYVVPSGVDLKSNTANFM